MRKYSASKRKMKAVNNHMKPVDTARPVSLDSSCSGQRENWSISASGRKTSFWPFNTAKPLPGSHRSGRRVFTVGRPILLGLPRIGSVNCGLRPAIATTRTTGCSLSVMAPSLDTMCGPEIAYVTPGISERSGGYLYVVGKFQRHPPLHSENIHKRCLNRKAPVGNAPTPHWRISKRASKHGRWIIKPTCLKRLPALHGYVTESNLCVVPARMG